MFLGASCFWKTSITFAPSHDAGSWAEKTSFAPGIKDDGTFYTEEEVKAMLEDLERSGP